MTDDEDEQGDLEGTKQRGVGDGNIGGKVGG